MERDGILSRSNESYCGCMGMDLGVVLKVSFSVHASLSFPRQPLALHQRAAGVL